MSDGFDSPNPFAPLPPRRGTQNTAAEMVIMKSAGERASKSRKLNDDAQADYRRFLETSHPLEREALHHLAILEVRTLLQDNSEQRQQKWEPSKELSKVIKKTIRALLVMPNLQYYGGSLSATIIDAMRKSGTPGLPEDDSLIKDCLSHPLSVDKNTIKTALKKSMTSKVKEERTIAYATSRILSSFGVAVQPTLSLYYRFALIRTELAQNHSNDIFWTKVDDILEEYHKEGAAGFVLCMEENFQDDVDQYGDPAKTDFKLSTNPLADNAPKWLKHIHDLAPKVRRLDNDLRSRKRRRIRDEAEDEEEDQPVDGDSGNSVEGSNGGIIGSEPGEGEEPEPVSES
ncbi:hypothetical protein C8R45DRAFT_1115490 [Mycena sanguinolenta]|nr:hypothetical protein C8R45DRAFT_1115490 [Mycena sanguinolenta]